MIRLLKVLLLAAALLLLLAGCGATQSEEAADAADIAEPEEDFYISEITDDIFARIEGKSFKDDCTLPREDLRCLRVLHVDLDGAEHEGEMIVNCHIAEDVLDILKQL